jgi:hypothetical protein
MSVKYRISYRRLSNNITTIDILDSSYGGGIINLTPDADPLNIAINGNVESIYTPTVGSGATIKALSLPLSLVSLFTTDPQKYMVKIYNGISGTNLVWQGFVNTGLYSENYSTGYNVQNSITIECNDGMALLDEYYYKPIDSSFYTGFATIGTVLTNILNKLNITFTNIYTSNDLTTASAGTNFFTLLKVNNENYVDENVIAMSCREVLDSIFGALGLTMSFRGSNIYVIDPINLHDTAKGKVYDTATFTENASTLGGYLDISNKDINWFETGSNMDIVQSFNKIEVNYDPYSFIEANYGFDSDNLIPETAGWSWGGSADFALCNNALFKDWSITEGLAFDGIKAVQQMEGFPDVLGEPVYFIRETSVGTGSYSYTFPLSNIKQDDNLLLELSMDVFLNTKNAYNILTPTEPETKISNAFVGNIEIKIGDKWYDSSSNIWQDTQCYSFIYVRELEADIVTSKYKDYNLWPFYHWRYFPLDLSVVNDKWIPSLLHIPLSEAVASGVDLVNGSIQIIISKKFKVLSSDEIVSIPGLILPNGTNIPPTYVNAVINLKSVDIKNIGIKIVGLDKSPIANTGIETVANLNDDLTRKKSPLSIKLTNGTGPYGVSRGAFSGLNETVSGTNIIGLYRQGDATIHNTTELLTQSLLSQYKVPRSKLTGTLNVKDCLLGVTTKLIKDSTYSKDENGNPKAFYIVGGTYNDRYENMNVQMIECASTRDSII